MRRTTTAALLLALATAAHADRIQLKNGSVIEGRVVSSDAKLVLVEANGMRMSLKPEMIVSITQQQAWENTVIEAESVFRRRQAVAGVELLAEARRQGAPADRLRTIIEQQYGTISSAVFQANADGKRELAASLRFLMAEDLLTTKTLFLASLSFFQMQEWNDANEALRRIPEETLRADPLMRQWALELMRGSVRRHLAAGAFADAIMAIEDMRRVVGDQGDADFPLAHLARSAAARDRGDFKTAFTVIAEDLAPTMPEIARNRAAFTVTALLNAARRTRELARHRVQLEPIREAFPVEYLLATVQLVEEEVREAADVGDHQRVFDLAESIEERQRPESLRLARLNAFHALELERIGENNPLELFRHARWCADNGLHNEAIAILLLTRTNPTLTDLSDQLIAIARQDRDTRLMERANTAFKEGRFDEARALARQVTEDPGRQSLLMEDGVKLLTLIEKSSRRDEERRPYDAEVMFQRGERAFYTQSLEESFQLLNLVLREYPQTPAAKRAADLLPDVVQALELAFLEGRPVSLAEVKGAMPLDHVRHADQLAAEINLLLPKASQ